MDYMEFAFDKSKKLASKLEVDELLIFEELVALLKEYDRLKE